jgi:hypothetical protein
MKLMRQLTWCACKYNFTFSAKHVPGVKNNLADSLSRSLSHQNKMFLHFQSLPHKIAEITIGYNSKNAIDNVLSLTKGKSSDHLQIDKFRQLAPQAEKHPHLCPSVSEVMWN